MYTDMSLNDLHRWAASTIFWVMNYVKGGVTKIYRRHGFLDEKREALNKWSRRLEVTLGRDDDREEALRG